MKKSDLRTGMRVEMRKGDTYMVIKDVDSELYEHQDIAFVRQSGFLNGGRYTDDLMRKHNITSEWDIVKVYSIRENENYYLTVDMLDLSQKHLIWERKEFPQLHKKYYYPIFDYPDEPFSSYNWENDDIDNAIKKTVGIYKTPLEAIQKGKELGWVE